MRKGPSKLVRGHTATQSAGRTRVYGCVLQAHGGKLAFPPPHAQTHAPHAQLAHLIQQHAGGPAEQLPVVVLAGQRKHVQPVGVALAPRRRLLLLVWGPDAQLEGVAHEHRPAACVWGKGGRDEQHSALARLMRRGQAVRVAAVCCSAAG
jgi:hypothetical protein